MSDTRFKKGYTPWNKGKKTGIRPHNKLWEKGHITWNTRELYSERIDRDGYILIKVEEPNVWMKKHRWLYEQKFGKVPEGSVVIFADKDKNNFDLDNLICVTRNELNILNRCKLISSIPELTKTGLNVAKIKAKLYELRKEKK